MCEDSNSCLIFICTRLRACLPAVSCYSPVAVCQARRYDWYDDTDRTAAATTIWRCLLAAPGGRVTPHPEVTGAARSAANAAAACGPVLLRGVAAGWRAVDAWQLGYLQRTGFSGKVRVAPSLQFPFCEPQLAQILVQLKGEWGAWGPLGGRARCMSMLESPL
jgi:hypothetical protein